MVGLGPATHVLVATAPLFAESGLMGGSVYILTNRRNGTLYVGTTVDLARRLWEHREVSRTALQSGMAYVDSSMLSTTQYSFGKKREMNIKHWPRAWKVR